MNRICNVRGKQSVLNGPRILAERTLFLREFGEKIFQESRMTFTPSDNFQVTDLVLSSVQER
jgi:hypothetical protein